MGGRGVALRGGVVMSIHVLFEEVGEIFVEADLEEGFFEEGAFDGLVELEVDVFSDDVGQSWGAVVGVDVLLFFLHLN